MHFERRIEVPAPVSEVWSFLWQVERLAGCLPGCQAVRTVEPEHRYEATLEERIGPFKARFVMDITVLDRQPEQLVRLVAIGKDTKLGASTKAELEVRLSSNAASGSVLNLVAEVQVTGKVATLGQVAIKRKADELMTRFAQQLGEQLQATGAGRRDA